MQDLLAWTILATDLDPGQQCAAIILQLGGAARELCRNMSFTDMTSGGQVGGTHVDPATFLLSHLATHSAPLGEEQRLAAVGELMQFRRNPGESLDALLPRSFDIEVSCFTGQRRGNYELGRLLLAVAARLWSLTPTTAKLASKLPRPIPRR